jgi:hypothetical protein
MGFPQGLLAQGWAFAAFLARVHVGSDFGAILTALNRHKNPKRSRSGLSKADLRWYIPPAPKGICPGRLLRKPPDSIDRRLRRWFGSLRYRFFEGAQWFIAGWSSPVARQAHNLKVTGSNPVPATKIDSDISEMARFGGLFHLFRSVFSASLSMRSP